VRRLAIDIYRTVARLSAWVLNSSRIVESVFVHRSVATGEASFGHSDIDLVIVVRQPKSDSADGIQLASLYEKVRWLRKLNPAIKHLAVQDWNGLNESIRSDTYLGSQDRRSAMVMGGKHVVFADIPVQPEHALRHFALWQEGHLAGAIQWTKPSQDHRKYVECVCGCHRIDPGSFSGSQRS
jgi:predicted nucleotidyltransferase